MEFKFTVDQKVRFPEMGGVSECWIKGVRVVPEPAGFDSGDEVWAYKIQYHIYHLLPKEGARVWRDWGWVDESQVAKWQEMPMNVHLSKEKIIDLIVNENAHELARVTINSATVDSLRRDLSDLPHPTQLFLVALLAYYKARGSTYSIMDGIEKLSEALGVIGGNG